MMALKTGILTPVFDLAVLYGGSFLGRLVLGHPDCVGEARRPPVQLLDDDCDCAAGLLSLSQAVGTLTNSAAPSVATAPVGCTGTAQRKD